MQRCHLVIRVSHREGHERRESILTALSGLTIGSFSLALCVQPPKIVIQRVLPHALVGL
jgi:hypothetical protein